MSSNSNEIEKVRQLFQNLVPEVAAGVIEIRGIVRESGNRSILAVVSKDPGIDAVGACVGNRGDRVKQVVERLGGEFVDIVLWNESAERFIANLLAPMHFVHAAFDEATHEATVQIATDSDRPLAGRLALQMELLLQLTGWNLRLER
jgi:transcription termination/antitermination protein NusA